MDKIQISFLLYILIFLNGVECSKSNKKYNESCTTEEVYYDECSYDSNQGFRCHPELHVCRCFNETSMFYDKETCFVKDFGSQCTYKDTYTTFQCNRKNKLYCDELSESCQCRMGYLPSTPNSSGNSETKCLPANEQVFCSDSMPCHESTGLVCAGGQCRCPRPLSQIFREHHEKKCVGLPEAIDGCDPKQEGTISQCVGNSYCGEDGKCHCKVGYSHEYGYRSSCGLDYGQPCNMTEESNFGRYFGSGCSYGRGFRCRDGICRCNKAPDTQYDSVQNVCAITQGHFCKTGSNLPCFTGLQCKSNGSDVETCEKVGNDNEENEGN